MMALPTEIRGRVTYALAMVLAGLSVIAGMWQDVEARDLFTPKEQATTEVDPTQSPSFDEQKKGIPQSLFTWIKMAKGYDVEWDTFGRKGWYTQDPRLKPVEPGSVFPRDIPAIYICSSQPRWKILPSSARNGIWRGKKVSSHPCRSARTSWKCLDMNAMDSWNLRNPDMPGTSEPIW